MAPPPIVTATIQSAVLAATSNLLAQGLTAYQDEVRIELYPNNITHSPDSVANYSPDTICRRLGSGLPVRSIRLHQHSAQLLMVRMAYGELAPFGGFGRVLLNPVLINKSGKNS